MSELRRSQDARDAEQDERINWPKDEERKSLVWIAINRDTLVCEYMDWVRLIDQGGVTPESLVRWEIERFGTALYPAAHRILGHGVRVARGFVKHERARHAKGGNDGDHRTHGSPDR